MLPEQRKIIMENQKLLYSFRKRGTDLPEKALTLLSKKIDKAYKTMQKSIDELKQHNIILDSNDFLLNSSFAYFAGFYVTDDEVEVELLDFQLEPVLEKIVPALKKRVHYETIHEVMEIMKNMIDEISENVTIESISIIFNKCMNYQNNLAYCENGLDLKLYNLSVQFKTCKAFMPSVFQDVFVGDDVLAYTLYLREKVFESNSIVYYDLDQNRLSYIMNNILQKNTNPAFGMIFPRFTQQQRKLFQKLESVSDKEYVNILIDNMEQFNSIETTYMQIKALLNPEYFVFGGKWLRKTQFEDFIFRNTKIFNSYKELANILFVESPSYSFFNVMNKDEQQQKGAGIYAAYSFFDWELKW